MSIDNRITRLFKEKQEKILSVFVTAGFPEIDSLASICEALEASGVHMVEIGVPFSDPTADGPTIQKSSERAINNGMTLAVLFEQLERIREKVSIPLLLMGYLNPILQYGMERFCNDCEKVGIDGVIVPDLPPQEYIDKYKERFDAKHISMVFLITSETSDERIKMLDKNSDGFIYAVSTHSTTGLKLLMNKKREAYFKKIKNLKTKNPIILGFGISDKESFDKACEFANGAIIGSAFIRQIENSKDLQSDVKSFVGNVLG